MPLALDLISTLTSGWILPVATTERARSPFSTEARREGSISFPPRLAATRPRVATSSRPMTAKVIRRRRLFRPFPFPFAIVSPIPGRRAGGPPGSPSPTHEAPGWFTRVAGPLHNPGHGPRPHPPAPQDRPPRPPRRV